MQVSFFPNAGEQMTHQKAGEEKPHGILPFRIKEFSLHGKIKGDFGEKRQREKPAEVSAKIPGMEVAFDQQETKEWKTDPSDDIAEDKVQSGGGVKCLCPVVCKHADAGDQY